MRKKFEAVIFDLDGTLIDSLLDIANTVNAVLRKQGVPEHAPDVYRGFIGDGISMTLMRALPEAYRNGEVVGACIDDLHTLFMQNFNCETTLYDGIPGLLDGLSDRGVRMAVLSNKADELTRRCIDELLPEWHFEAVIGQRDGVAAKPDPNGALEIAVNLGLSPGQFAYLGDTGVDMKTAIAAGMFPVGALWGFRPEEELRGAGAVGVLDSPLDLLAFFE